MRTGKSSRDGGKITEKRVRHWAGNAYDTRPVTRLFKDSGYCYCVIGKEKDEKYEEFRHDTGRLPPASRTCVCNRVRYGNGSERAGPNGLIRISHRSFHGRAERARVRSPSVRGRNKTDRTVGGRSVERTNGEGGGGAERKK